MWIVYPNGIPDLKRKLTKQFCPFCSGRFPLLKGQKPLMRL